MNPYGKTKNWLCRRSDHLDTPLASGRSVPSLLRLDSTGERDFRSSTGNNMASCFVKTIGGITQRNNMFAKDNVSGDVSDFPILQNSYHCVCDKNMAAKDNISLTKPPTSCLGSFQGLAGCLGLNTGSPISQHPTLHQGQFQVPYVQFHPAVVSDFPQQTQSARKQFVKCQSQRTGKKSNRYIRYGWRSPPKKSNLEGEKASAQTKSEDNAVCKKQKCDKLERVQQAGKMKLESDSKNEDKIKCSDIKSRECLSSQMSNLSLGESVAIKKALNEGTKPISVSPDAEKPKPDWFSIDRRDSETKLSPSKMTVCDNWDDEICEEIQSENTKLQEDILDLLATDEININSESNVQPGRLFQSSEINGPQNVIVESDCENTCVSRSLVNGDETQKDDTDIRTSICQNNEPHAVLYQRNSNKKCRPSNKKRSRRKSSKHSKSFKCEVQGQKRKLENESSSQSGASSIAFILGNSVPSMLDSDSDFSFDSDEDSSESADDDIDFVNHFAEPLCLNVVSPFAEPLCVKVIFPAKSNSFHEVSEAVRAANRAWQISLQQSSPKTAQEGDKKVCVFFFLI